MIFTCVSHFFDWFVLSVSCSSCLVLLCVLSWWFCFWVPFVNKTKTVAFMSLSPHYCNQFVSLSRSLCPSCRSMCVLISCDCSADEGRVSVIILYSIVEFPLMHQRRCNAWLFFYVAMKEKQRIFLFIFYPLLRACLKLHSNATSPEGNPSVKKKKRKLNLGYFQNKL